MSYALIVDGNVAAFPYSVEAFRAEQAQRSQEGLTSTSLPLDPTAEQLAEVGIVPVVSAPMPLTTRSEKVHGFNVVNVDGVWTKQWTVVPLPVEELRASLSSQVKAKQDEVRQAGWTHTFSVGEHTLDLRDADDKANWHLLLTKTHGMKSAGYGAAPIKIRTAANVRIQVTADEAFDAMQAFLTWGEQLLENKWELDDAIAAAETLEELLVINPNVGWPA